MSGWDFCSFLLAFSLLLPSGYKISNEVFVFFEIRGMGKFGDVVFREV
jgi:hypothetical protein